ncbi:unnamed protein product [Parajaminaea phylloscopi]
MSSTATSAATAVPRTLPTLYRHLLRSSRATFQNDAQTMAAWRQYVRQKMPAQAQDSNAQGPEGTLSEQFVSEWLDVAKILRMNIVQGVRKAGSEDVYQLRFTKDTELGSNDTIKKGRDKQLADLKASKGVLRCGGAAAFSASSSSRSSSRAFSTSSRNWTPRAAEKLKDRPSAPLPHPAPQFPSTTVLADGSSISLMTTSPRSVARLTRDPTNHPLWNPILLEKGKGAGGTGDDDAGRMERFRRRFAGSDMQQGQQSTSEVKSDTAAQSKTAGSSASKVKADTKTAQAEQANEDAKPKTSGSMFDFDDLQWMSGGRQAKAGTPLEGSKGAKGKKK